MALQADGWYLRSDIIWAKPNPMPESVTDRPTKSHEYLFLLTKAPRYFYDADAVREDSTERGSGNVDAVWEPGKSRAEANFKHSIPYQPTGTGRNRRSVWTVATQPYPGAHFATFPPKLVEPCIKAGTSERGVCAACGAPWRRVVEREGGKSKAVGKSDAKRGVGLATAFSGYDDGSKAPTFTTIGWEHTCGHAAKGMVNVVRPPAGPVPAVVLDPFGGSGTTAMVAQALGRKAILVELNPEYAAQSLRRATRHWGVGGKPERGERPVPEDSWLAAIEAAS